MSVQNNSNNLDAYLRRRHSVSYLVIHLVFTTKYRRKLLEGYMYPQLEDAFKSACEKLECELLEFKASHQHYGQDLTLLVQQVVRRLRLCENM